MEFLKFSVDGEVFGNKTTEIGSAKRDNEDDTRPADWKPSSDGFNFYDDRITEQRWRSHTNAESIRKLFTLLAVCHTVIPEQDTRDKTKISYQAASPDEGALVKAAANLGLRLLERTPSSVTIDADGEQETYEILNVLEFNSTRKRMSVIVRTPDNKIVLMTKGADNVIYQLMNPSTHSEQTLINLKLFAEEGLRTLVCAQVELDEVFYKDWNKNVFEQANTTLEDKEEAVAKAAEQVERNLELVGATAIEDKLQEGVPHTISELAKAGIKIWVLTGDKQETAINIGYACKLLDNRMGIMILNNTNRAQLKEEIRNSLRMAENGEIMGDSGLAVVIDGASLDLVLQQNSKKEHAHEPTIEEKHLQEPTIDHDLPGEETLAVTFLKLCMLCRSVVCCRVSPLQKALVVKLVRENLHGSVTLAIGDGANDVSMIQAANIGVGISGQEGLQAARAADYAIGQFRFLRKLLLVHGRYNYRRIGKLICYSFYKNLTLQLCQLWYAWFNAVTGATIYDSLLLIMFNLIFSALPILAFAIFDRDVSVEASMAVPQLYILGQRSNHLNMRVFAGWIITGIWHSLVCFFVPCLAVTFASSFFIGAPPDYALLSYMVYTCVIVVITLKLGVESSTWTVAHFLSFFGSILSWFVVAGIYASLWIILVQQLPKQLSPLVDISKTSFGTAFNASGNWLFWLTLLLTIVLALAKDVIWKSIVHNITFGNQLRQLYHVIRDLERSGVTITEETVKSNYPLLNDIHPPLRRLPDSIYLSGDLSQTYQVKKRASMQLVHTGYSFSQTEGGQAELVRTASDRATREEIIRREHRKDSTELTNADELTSESNIELGTGW
jgi:magnesium-transporting ATPase (P-type)